MAFKRLLTLTLVLLLAVSMGVAAQGNTPDAESDLAERAHDHLTEITVQEEPLLFPLLNPWEDFISTTPNNATSTLPDTIANLIRSEWVERLLERLTALIGSAEPLLQ